MEAKKYVYFRQLVIERLYKNNHGKYMSYDKLLRIHKFFHINKNEEYNKKHLLYKIRPSNDHANSIFQKYNVHVKCLDID